MRTFRHGQNTRVVDERVDGRPSPINFFPAASTEARDGKSSWLVRSRARGTRSWIPVHRVRAVARIRHGQHDIRARGRETDRSRCRCWRR